MPMALLNKIKCFRCHGRGEIEYEILNMIIFHVTETWDCPACHGRGWIYE